MRHQVQASLWNLFIIYLFICRGGRTDMTQSLVLPLQPKTISQPPALLPLQSSPDKEVEDDSWHRFSPQWSGPTSLVSIAIPGDGYMDPSLLFQGLPGYINCYPNTRSAEGIYIPLPSGAAQPKQLVFMAVVCMDRDKGLCEMAPAAAAPREQQPASTNTWG